MSRLTGADSMVAAKRLTASASDTSQASTTISVRPRRRSRFSSPATRSVSPDRLTSVTRPAPAWAKCSQNRSPSCPVPPTISTCDRSVSAALACLT
ncbi:Uncharacterised protein [Mycobacteroides abscessus subsp. abscessus]|nr:Uncharacterised protein [Mycobacteroides abscessus subsp. abscessus]